MVVWKHSYLEKRYCDSHNLENTHTHKLQYLYYQGSRGEKNEHGTDYLKIIIIAENSPNLETHKLRDSRC